MGEPLLDVTFTATPDDFIAYAEHLATEGEFYRSQMRSTRGVVVAIVLVASLLLASIVTPDWDPFAMLTYFLVGCGVALILWFTWPRIWRRQLRTVTRRQAAMENPLVISGVKRYIFDESGVRFSGQYSGGYVMWPAVMRITGDENALYLHVSQASAHIVPRRAFASDQDFAAARELAVCLKGQTPPDLP